MLREHHVSRGCRVGYFLGDRRGGNTGQKSSCQGMSSQIMQGQRRGGGLLLARRRWQLLGYQKVLPPPRLVAPSPALL